ncbi:hypothetical protein MKX08_010352 [Trichoderma sp. CBMAI-0020]|nr:hypothetical protein MKX08_010352 [Trichoderma sp. CBMAI-0020]
MDKDKGCCESLQVAAPQHASCSDLGGAGGGSHTILARAFGQVCKGPESQCGHTVACLTKVTPLRLGREILIGKRRDEKLLTMATCSMLQRGASTGTSVQGSGGMSPPRLSWSALVLVIAQYHNGSVLPGSLVLKGICTE